MDCLDDSSGIVDWPGDDDFSTTLTDYFAAREPARGRVGSAASALLDAGDLVAFAAAWMTQRFGS